MRKFPRPLRGVLKEIKVADGTTVQINTVVAVIDESGAGAAAPAAPAAKTEAAPAASAAKPQDDTAPAAAQNAICRTCRQLRGPATDVVMPQMGESIFEGTITKWLKQVGDTVERDEPLFEISTDKVDAEIPSPAAGVLTEIKVGRRQDRPDQHGRRCDRRRSGRTGGCRGNPAPQLQHRSPCASRST